MQTVLLKLYEYKKEFESEEHMKHWILRVAVNESRRVLRSFWRRNRLSGSSVIRETGLRWFGVVKSRWANSGAARRIIRTPQERV